jgi:hypothetical protein
VKRVATLSIALVACARNSAPPPTPIESVSVAPQSTGSPNEPALLVGPQKQADPPGDLERVRVSEERPESDWKPPKDRCPEGITEMMAVHVPLGDAMELSPGASPVLAMGAKPDAVDVLFDPARKVVRVVAKTYGLVYVLVKRDKSCTFYGVSSGY